MIGEIGGSAEEAAAVDQSELPEARGRVHRRRKGTAAEEMAALSAPGVKVVKSPADMGKGIQEVLAAKH
jgi:succinyl-CoA synthetase alpha subunit